MTDYVRTHVILGIYFPPRRRHSAAPPSSTTIPSSAMNRCLSPYLTPSAGAGGLASRIYFSPLRPRRIPNSHVTTAWKRATSTVGINKTGHIDIRPGEGLLFFDSSFPLVPGGGSSGVLQC